MVNWFLSYGYTNGTSRWDVTIKREHYDKFMKALLPKLFMHKTKDEMAVG